MSVAKNQQISSTLIRVPFQGTEKSEFEAFFDDNKALKKGETIRAWVMEAIRERKGGK